MKNELIYGIHAVRFCLSHTPDRAIELFIKEDNKQESDFQAILELAKTHGVSINPITVNKLEQKTGTSQHQGVLLVCKPRPEQQEKDLKVWLQQMQDKNLLFLVLDGVQDPHNLGACLRTADAAGVDAVIIPKDKSASLTPVVVKVACGAADTVRIFRVTNLARSLRLLKENEVWVLGTDGDAEQNLFHTNFASRLALVLGSEGQGLRENTRKHCDQLISIPMQGSVESLNVSTATAICLFEVLRQRQALR